MITSSMKPRSAATNGLAKRASYSLVRAAITLLVQRPALALALDPPWSFAELRQPGIPLLVELIALCRARANLGTGALLEHFAERDEAKALQKLAVTDFPGGETEARAEFLDAAVQLERQTLQQRIDDFLKKDTEGAASESERAALRAGRVGFVCCMTSGHAHAQGWG